MVSVDTAAHRVICAAGMFEFPPLSPTLIAILEAGGLIPMLRKRLEKEQGAYADHLSD
jgi:hypothetical protein